MKVYKEFVTKNLFDSDGIYRIETSFLVYKLEQGA